MTPVFIGLYILSNTVCGTLGFGLLTDILFREKVTIKRALMSSLSFLVTSIVTVGFGLRNSAVGTIIGFVAYWSFVWLRYRYPFGKALLLGFIVFIISIVDDLIGSLTLMPLMGAEAFELGRTCQHPGYAIFMTSMVLLYAGIAGLFILLIRKIVGVRKKHETGRTRIIWMFVRPVLLVIADIWAFGQAMQRIRDQAATVIWAEMLSNYALLLVLLIVSVTYIVQDIRYIQQYRRNETLESEKRITDVLLKNLRTFRHNVANMLYGFEGYILNGNTDELQGYYKDIVHRCSLINNENIVMLQNIPSKAVVGLLLHHIDKINQAEIPMTVYVDRNFKLNGLRDTDVCEILGVLLDNALEAAQQSAVPSVSVEMRNLGNSLEMIVRNSIASTEKIDFAVSSKPGHEGIGLESIRTLLGKRGAFLNMRSDGQYVEAQILVG